MPHLITVLDLITVLASRHAWSFAGACGGAGASERVGRLT